MKSNKILVLGYLGYITNQLDGQTLKTRSIYELLKSKEKAIGNVEYFDTQSFQHSKLSIFQLLFEIAQCNYLIYLPAQKNLRFLFPSIYYLCKLMKTEILYLVVGGWLSNFLEDKKIIVSHLKRIKGIFVETTSLKRNLEDKFKFENVNWFPNFRNHSFVPEFKINSTELKIVFMARINRLKGLDVVFNLSDYCFKKKISSKIIIDFYGPIEDSDYEYFTKEIEAHTNTRYKGIIQPNFVYSTLSEYDLLILPTKYYTEGFPGSILDAYISGIPVIVTKWENASEFVIDQVTGYIVPFEKGERNLNNLVLNLLENKELLLKLKHQAYTKSKEYSRESAWAIIMPYLKK